MGKRGDTIKNNRNIAVIKAPDGNNVVIINDIRFKGKRSIDWNDVKNYLKEYIGDVYTIADTKEIVYIGSDLPCLFIWKMVSLKDITFSMLHC